MRLDKWADVLCSYVGRLCVVKVLILPKLIYRFSATPNQIPANRYPSENDRLILKFTRAKS